MKMHTQSQGGLRATGKFLAQSDEAMQTIQGNVALQLSKSIREAKAELASQ